MERKEQVHSSIHGTARTGQDHGNIPKPNVKEPNYNNNPYTGDKFFNGYKIRPADPWELPY